jgi:hypothetical protein
VVGVHNKRRKENGRQPDAILAFPVYYSGKELHYLGVRTVPESGVSNQSGIYGSIKSQHSCKMGGLGVLFIQLIIFYQG